MLNVINEDKVQIKQSVEVYAVLERTQKNGAWSIVSDNQGNNMRLRIFKTHKQANSSARLLKSKHKDEFYEVKVVPATFRPKGKLRVVQPDVDEI